MRDFYGGPSYDGYVVVCNVTEVCIVIVLVLSWSHCKY